MSFGSTPPRMGLKSMPKIIPDGDVQKGIGSQLRCSVCPGRSICLEWHRSLSLRLDYDEIVAALECLDDVLEKSAWRFSLCSPDRRWQLLLGLPRVCGTEAFRRRDAPSSS
jgi:hypothetical protein